MLKAGACRVIINPQPGVELTGWGYYIERLWQSIHDDLFATAVVVEGGQNSAIVISVDLMVIDERFTTSVRRQVAAATDVPADAIMLTATHTHNAPATGGLLGVGECDEQYELWVANRVAECAIHAWRSCRPATLRTATTECPGLTFNRTRPNGVVDPTLSLALLESPNGGPIAVVANHGGHPTVATELHPFAISRDIPGVVCDRLEVAFPGAVALYFQGACGDCNFQREFSTEERWRSPGDRLAEAGVAALQASSPSENDAVAAIQMTAELTTRRWTPEEIESPRREAQQRLNKNDFDNWRETIGRSMTNLPDDMINRHGGNEEKAVRAMCRFQMEWTNLMRADYETREEVLCTEVQALRIGELTIVANSSEFFSPFALDVRRRIAQLTDDAGAVMIACYANGRIGYLPDEHDIDVKSYAGYQSPKYCNQFPFTAESGVQMCDAMVAAASQTT